MQWTGPRKMGFQKVHLVGQDFSSLQVDIFSMCGRERDRDQLHASLLRRTARFKIVAPDAGSDNIVPGILTAQPERSHMIPGQVPGAEPVPAIHAHVGVALKQRNVVQRRNIILLQFAVGLAVTAGGENGVDFQDTSAMGATVVTTPHHQFKFTAGIGYLIKGDQVDGTLVIDPLQGHTGYIRSKNGL